MKRAAGFTLVELLVAMFITAIMFTIGYGAINQAIGNREIVDLRQERLLAVQRAMQLLLQDFTELAPRLVREPGGDWKPALSVDARNQALVELTRAGWANPAGVQRAQLQRVRYVLRDKKLTRETFRVLDAPLGAEPRRRELLDRVTSVKLRFMDEGRTWRELWPTAAASGPLSLPDQRSRPIAVEVTIELEDWGKLVRLIEVAG